MKRAATREYDLYVPLKTASGAVSRSRVGKVKQALVARFGGVTEFRHRNKGTWRCGRSLYRDDMLLLRVLTSEPVKAERWMQTLKKQLETSLQQKEILVVRRSVAIL